MRQPIEKEAYRVVEFCQAYGIGRSTFYEEMQAGRIKVIKLGKITLISKKSAEQWLKNLTKEQK